MHIFELAIITMRVLTQRGWYGAGSEWKFFLTKKWANQICQKVKIILFTQPQVHKRGDRYV